MSPDVSRRLLRAAFQTARIAVPHYAAERLRADAEELRQGQERLRQSQEQTRITAEETRGAAEESRLAAAKEVADTVATLTALLERMEAVEHMRRASRSANPSG